MNNNDNRGSETIVFKFAKISFRIHNRPNHSETVASKCELKGILGAYIGKKSAPYHHAIQSQTQFENSEEPIIRSGVCYKDV